MSEEKTVDQIAEEIIGGSDGAFSLHRTDEYQALEPAEQSQVDDLVSEQIDACGNCGWNFYIDSMEASGEFDELICWKCADDERMEAEEAENNEECGRCGETNDFNAMNMIEGEYVCVNCETNEDE